MKIIDIGDWAAMPVNTIAFTDDADFVSKAIHNDRLIDRLYKRKRRFVNPDVGYRWKNRIHVELEKI